MNPTNPRLQESQILQNSSEILANFAFLTRILQVCTRIASFANLLQCRTFPTKSDNISAKIAFLREKNSYKKCDV